MVHMILTQGWVSFLHHHHHHLTDPKENGPVLLDHLHRYMMKNCFSFQLLQDSEKKKDCRSLPRWYDQTPGCHTRVLFLNKNKFSHIKRKKNESIYSSPEIYFNSICVCSRVFTWVCVSFIVASFKRDSYCNLCRLKKISLHMLQWTNHRVQGLNPRSCVTSFLRSMTRKYFFNIF